MERSTIAFVAAIAFVAVAEAALIGRWASGSGAVPVEPRVPGVDRLAASGAFGPAGPTRIAGRLVEGAARPGPALPGCWPQFRGADRTGIATSGEVLPVALPDRLPVLWRLRVGEGHAGVAVRSGKVYLHDYDSARSEDAIRCLSLADGSELWRYAYPSVVKRNHGMSRTVPALHGRYLVALGPKCIVTCLDATSGALQWQMDLVTEHHTVVPPWYAGQCPLAQRGAAIVAPGADPLLMAVDLATRRIRWRVPNPGGWEMAHTSVVPIVYRGESQYVLQASRGVIGVRASDGLVRWRFDRWAMRTAAVPSPLPVGSDRLLLTGGYGLGCALIRLKGEPGRMEVEELFRLRGSVFGSEQQTPLHHDGLVYSTIPAGCPAYGELACLDPDTGRCLWTSGKSLRFGLGPYMMVGGKILILGDQTGDLHLVEVSRTGCRSIRKWHVVEGHDAWAPMALAGGRLILRNLSDLVCLDLARGGR